MKRFEINASYDVDGKRITREIIGRYAWALLELKKAGKRGCTPIDNPAPRWSAYIHQLRHEYGLDIQTIWETHKGPFPGNHARYVLQSNVSLEPVDSSAEVANGKAA
ncbi:hypothetical protein J0X12_15050 [Sneathiella sp. CAU 1612]|uniref:Winged helix domain-containing protein n=1 Tax=Sneathiella sedimenti TaxID=2816034 RepID=A0ABS3F8U9_9PROT|nr:helix-turn-helix domain-containing protein [Sneathiella sedimenti]MBO0334942.1 hypothetical protein [Sneathiella sedimenti]